MATNKILFILGTRPEVIKLAPVITGMMATDALTPVICVTAQHREMMDQMLRLFKLEPTYDLDAMAANQSLAALSAKLITGLDEVVKTESPAWICVQGDTTTSFIGALVGAYQQIPTCHIEAGLRSGNKFAPWPEEMNRKMTSQIADLHFAPTEKNVEALIAENIPSQSIHQVGNTVIDALFYIASLLEKPDTRRRMEQTFSFLDHNKKRILVTGHRRENFGHGFQQICSALKKIAEIHNVEIVYPVHLNPNVKKCVEVQLSGYSNIHLMQPMDYLSFVYLLKTATLVLTDSGGIQEEAPAFGVPVLVMRDVTERQEAVDAGTAILVGTEADKIIQTTQSLLKNNEQYQQMAKAHNPFGQGHAAKKIIEVLMRKMA